ncbi:MAG: hypothetical protein QM754_14830 [Tepidisphaeraceae bacterium]
MRKIKSAALVALLAMCGVARADVLEKLPAGSLVAGRVANLSATSKKIAKLAKDLGIDAFVAPLQDPLGNFKTQTHFEKGINDNGEVGFAMIDGKAQSLPEDQSFVVLIPVTSYAEFLGNFAEPKTEGGVSEVTSPDGGGQTLFVADWGDGFAAVSPGKVMVTKPGTTLKVADAAKKESARQDFLVVTNFKELGPKLLPEIDKGQEEANKDLDRSPAGKLDAKYKPLAKTAIAQFFAAAKTFVSNADVATFGLNITDAGINSTVLASYTPDSYLAKVAAGMKGTDKPLTVGLPAMKYLVYGGATIDSANFAQVFDDFSKPIIAELEKIEGVDDAKKLTAHSTAALKQLKSMTFGMPVATQPGKEALIQQVAIYNGGAADWKAVFNEGGDFAKKMIASMDLPPDRPKPVLEQTLNAENIEGVSFDKIKLEAKPNPDAPGAEQAEQMQAIMYGPDGLNYLYGVSGESFIVANGTPSETLAAFVKSNKAGEDNLSKLDQLKVVVAELPKSRSLEYYVALDEFVNLGVSTAAQFGFPVQVQLPPDLPPLGITFGGEGQTMRLDTHLPTSTVQSLIAAGMQAFMGMRGGGGNL